MKLIWLLFLISILTFSSAAQETCQLEIKDAPALLGFRLGMSPDETQAVVGRDLKIKVKKSGQRTFFQNFITKAPPTSLAGVRAVYLRFYDGRLYQIEIFFEERNQWQTLEDLTGNLTAQWNFPNTFWQVKNGTAKINCLDFSIVARKILNPHVELTDEILRAKVEDERKKK